MTKDDIRKQIAEQKNTLGFQTLEKRSASVIEKLQTLELFKNAKTVGAYMPLPHEIDITLLFQRLETTWFIPAFDEALGSYRLAELTEEFKTGKFGISEPASPEFAPEELDLIIVPGAAFDHAGHRIGRGGGFYDRLLPQYNAVKVGACFDFQCLEDVPSDPYDINIDLLVTESQILKYTTNS